MIGKDESPIETGLPSVQDLPTLLKPAGAQPDFWIPGSIARQAEADPGRVAVASDKRILSYGEMVRQARQLARHLKTLGVGPNTLVGVCLDRSVELIIGMLAVLEAGGAYVPLDTDYPLARIADIFSDAGCAVAITHRRLADQIAAHVPAVVTIEDLALIGAPAEPLEVVLSPHDLLYVIYTSGSTGQPKGVAISHANFANLIDWHQHAFGVTSDDRASQIASPAFDATGWEVWPYLTAGASLHIPDEDTRTSEQRLRDWIVEKQITISFVPTPLAERIIELEWPRETRLRYLLTGGDRLHSYPPATLPFVFANNYGPTETTVVATSGLVAVDDAPTRPPSIGLPIANTSIYLLDEYQQPVPDGTPGEMYIGGDGVALGYHRRPSLTAERFLPDPFSDRPGARMYRTGDAAMRSPDGTIEFVGRIDSQIKIRGYRIEPQEIEAQLRRQPQISECAVAARQTGEGELQLVAYLIPAPGQHPKASALRDALLVHLPDYMVPSLFVVLDSMPLTTSGKLDRKALPPPEEAHLLREETSSAPSSPIEEELCAFVASLLGLDRVNIDDNFFLLGGHSLLGAQLIAHIEETYSISLKLRMLFETPTIRSLAEAIEQRIMAMVAAMSEEEALRRLQQ
jgi:amino acid adenylation domain-containing protein